MIETKISEIDTGLTPKGCFVLFYLPQNEAINDFMALKDKPLDKYVLTLKKKQNKTRSMHNYMWVLCEKIAQKISLQAKLNYTKEDVYKEAVKQVGRWYDTEIPTSDVESMVKVWESNGTGWFTEVIFSGESFTQLRQYYGASLYSGEELYRLTNYIVQEAKDLGIETITDSELKHLENLWESR